MKAILLRGFGGTENFEMRDDLENPAIPDTHVLVKIKAAGFNPVDYQMRIGTSEKARLHSPILGREFSGVVEKAGKFANTFKIGDPVFAASGSMGSNGSYAEYISVPESILSVKPENLSFEEAAAIPVAYLTAIQLVDRLKIDFKDSVLITGAAGGVGLALVKFMIASGHQKITVTAGNKFSRNHLKKTGLPAESIVDYTGDQLTERLRNANRGHDFDICIDLVGAKMAELSAELVKLNGIYADVTALGTEKSRSLLFDKGVIIFNISNYAYSLYNKYEWYGNNLRRIASMLSDKVISPPSLSIFAGLSVKSVTQAHNSLERNQTNGRKLVMII
ncbi:zinc-binding alcohol dehydrogenase family protein [Pedobacter antarcticus]|uniref:quinone oxidoreductase family protein n=1 Tax=Pedobacter antarcticus TaxID=34086 RepID=UPI001C55D961|nr:NADP-dependent oxidoreductase [Pedobacter antarcticus]